jgi:hypothetical protein
MYSLGHLMVKLYNGMLKYTIAKHIQYIASLFNQYALLAMKSSQSLVTVKERLLIVIQKLTEPA